MDTLFGATIHIPYNAAPLHVSRFAEQLAVPAGTFDNTPILTLTPAAGRNILITRLIIRGAPIPVAGNGAFEGPIVWYATNDGAPVEVFGINAGGNQNQMALQASEIHPDAVAIGLQNLSVLSVLVEVLDGTQFIVGAVSNLFDDVNVSVLAQGVEYDRY